MVYALSWKVKMILLIKLLRRRFPLFLAAFVACCLSVAITLWWNTELAGIINTVSAGIPPSPEIIKLVMVIMIVTAAGAWFKSYVSGFFCETVTHDLRMGYTRHFASLSLRQTESLNAGQELSKLQNEIADVSVYINGNLFQLIDDSIIFIITLVWLLAVNPALVFYVNGPCLLIVVYVFFSSKIIGKATTLSQQAKGRMNICAESLLTMFPVIKLYNAPQMMIANYDRQINDWETNTVKSEIVKARLMSLSGVLSTVPLILLLLTGGGMVINGSLSTGVLFMFLNLSGNVSGVMMNMPGYIAGFRQFSANIKLLEPKIFLAGRV